MTRVFVRFGNFSRPPLFSVMAGVLVGTLALFAASLTQAQKAEDSLFPGFGKFHVVRIDSDGVFPRNLRIERGATVIWYNATAGYSSVVFNEGEELVRATRSPTLFFLAPDGAYVSAAFDSGATASTAFLKTGVYRYFVTGLPTEEEAAFAEVTVR